jgi:hypothetical protein
MTDKAKTPEEVAAEQRAAHLQRNIHPDIRSLFEEVHARIDKLGPAEAPEAP